MSARAARRRPAPSRAAAIWLLLLGCAGAGVVFLTILNHDVGVGLALAARRFDGERLYVDMLETNPPLFVYLSLVPTALARAAGLPAIPVFQLWTLALAAGSVALSWTVVARARPLPRGPARIAFIGALAVILTSLSRFDFGQRDYLMFALTTPYLLLSAARAAGRRTGRGLALAAGVTAGLGMALKPFFALLFVVIEAYLTLLRRRGWFWRRPEALAVAGVHAVYAAVLLLLTPQYLEIVSMLLQAYSAFDATNAELLAKLWSIAPTITIGLAAYLLLPTRGAAREVARVLALAVACFVAVLFIQHKGYDYHYFPARAGGALLLAAVALGAVPRLAAALGRRWRGTAPLTPGLLRRRAGAVAAAVAVLLTIHTARQLQASWSEARARPEGTFGQIAALLERTAAGRPVMFFSSNVWPAFPLYNYSGARWPSRWVHLWVLPKYYRDTAPGPDGRLFHAPEAMEPLERFQLETVVEDFLRSRPVLVLLDVSPVKQGFGTTRFDFLAYFLRDPRFRAAWAGYEFRGTSGPFAIYQRREGDAGERPAGAPDSG